jgi:glucose-6-phosphate dehydrogenase-like protein
LGSFRQRGPTFLFGSAMAISFGIKSPFDYSVFPAMCCALFLGLAARIDGPSILYNDAPRGRERCNKLHAVEPNTGYETLLFDCVIGYATLFKRADNIEAGWQLVQPILDAGLTTKLEIFRTMQRAEAAPLRRPLPTITRVSPKRWSVTF